MVPPLLPRGCPLACPVPCTDYADIQGELHRTVDAIITLGGDGTILHAASLFSSAFVPPILSFSLGTLGFLLPFSTLHKTRPPNSTLSRTPTNPFFVLGRLPRLQGCVCRDVYFERTRPEQNAFDLSIDFDGVGPYD